MSEHIDSISLNPDVAIATTLRVAKAEVAALNLMPSGELESADTRMWRSAS